MKKKPLLLLVHRIPYPPNKGDKIRSYHLLQYLSESHDVHLGAFVDDPNDWQYEDVLKSLCESVYILPRKKHVQAIPSYIKALVQDQPLSNALYHSFKMRRWVDATIAKHHIEQVIVFSSNMGQYVERWLSKVKIVVDFVDVDSLKWEQYSQQKNGIAKWVYQREGRTLSRYEEYLATLSQANIFVSPQEAGHFKRRTGFSDKIISIRNGVDTAYFDPNRTYTNPFTQTLEHQNTFRLVFTGMMDYWPNIDAVQWFCASVMPALIQQIPNLKFYIVGANPVDAVKKLAHTHVIVTGRVDDIRPYLKYADLAVAPLRIARGIQNKVLEALSMNVPMIASPEALEGILIQQENVCDTASDAQEWIANIVHYFQQRKHSDVVHSPNAHLWVKDNYSWAKQLVQLERYLD